MKTQRDKLTEIYKGSWTTLTAAYDDTQRHTRTHRDTLTDSQELTAHPPPESCFFIILHVISAIIFFN